MALKNLMVVVDTSKPAAARIDAAAMLAARHDAHLTGLFVSAPPALPSYVAGELGDSVIALQQRMAQEIADEAAGLFRQRVELAGIGSRAEWRALRGDPTEVAGIVGRYADLVILGQIDPDRNRDVPPVHPEDVLFDCGRPVLMVPYAGRFPTIGEQVLVGWNASREAARALNDALPMLAGAEEVTVLALSPSRVAVQSDAAGSSAIVRHLKAHGIEAAADRLVFKAREIDPAERLLSHLADYGADLLVMGAWPRAGERNSLTTGVLARTTVPMLLSY